MKNVVFILTICSVLLPGAASVWAGSLTVPNTFSPNTPARADSVNENFSAVALEVNDNSSRITTLETGCVSISAFGMVPRDLLHQTAWVSFGSGDYGRRSAEASGFEYLFGTIQIPDGATVTSFSYYSFDQDATNDSYGFLRARTDMEMARVQTSGSGGFQTRTDTSIDFAVIDNSVHVYTVQLQIWGGTTITPISAHVCYQFQ